MEGWLEKIARDNWALYHRHPWMLQVAVRAGRRSGRT